jgi:hypothetical protein
MEPIAVFALIAIVTFGVIVFVRSRLRARD